MEKNLYSFAGYWKIGRGAATTMGWRIMMVAGSMTVSSNSLWQ